MFLIIAIITLGLFARGISGAVIEAPSPRNISANQNVEFTCATNNSDVGISWSTIPDVGLITSVTHDTGAGIHSVMRFFASADHSGTTVLCIVSGTGPLATIKDALLLVQGKLSAVRNLTSTDIDPCTLHFNWTAPYTLQGVPINYYIINITRHCDGVVLTSDTTNITEYHYNTVDSLGETLEVVVAAVNDVGIGDNSSITSSFTVNTNISVVTGSVVKNGSNWKYTFHILDSLRCSGAINDFTVRACLNSSYCTNATGAIKILPSGSESLTVTFSNLLKYQKFSASVHVLYNGVVEQQSQPVEISTFNVRNVSIDILTTTQLCITVEYIEDNNSPSHAYMRLSCPTTRYVQNKAIDGTQGCLNIGSLQSNQTCDVFVTDIDAQENIETTPAIVINGIIFPEHRITTTEHPPSITNISPTVTPTDLSNEDISSNLLIILYVGVSVIAASVMSIIVVSVMCIILCHKRATDVAKNPQSHLYESVHPLTVTKMPFSEEKAIIASCPQSDFELKECPAYGLI